MRSKFYGIILISFLLTSSFTFPLDVSATSNDELWEFDITGQTVVSSETKEGTSIISIELTSPHSDLKGSGSIIELDVEYTGNSESMETILLCSSRDSDEQKCEPTSNSYPGVNKISNLVDKKLTDYGISFVTLPSELDLLYDKQTTMYERSFEVFISQSEDRIFLIIVNYGSTEVSNQNNKRNSSNSKEDSDTTSKDTESNSEKKTDEIKNIVKKILKKVKKTLEDSKVKSYGFKPWPYIDFEVKEDPNSKIDNSDWYTR